MPVSKQKGFGQAFCIITVDLGSLHILHIKRMLPGNGIKTEGMIMAQGKDLTGQRFGHLMVVKKTEKTQDRYVVWKCRCDCGGEIEVNTKRLVRGTITNCGCIPKMTARKGPVAEDLTGQVFGNLTVLEKAESKSGRTQWKCRCTCGKETVVSARNLKSGKTKSCGCMQYVRKCRETDLTGQRFGRLVAQYATGKKTNRYSKMWHCRCDCGEEIDVPEDGLIYGNWKSCGCLKREVWENIPNQLHRIDGTCVEWLEKRKHRSDNTSGFRGVYHSKNGNYRVTIGFKGKRFYIGTYKKYEEAVEARLEAEEQIHDQFVRAYYIWKQETDCDIKSDEGKEPLVFEVEKINGRFEITTNVKV